MNLDRHSLVCLVFMVMGAAPAVADDASGEPPVKARAHVVKTKPKVMPSDAADIANIKFSDPTAPLGGGAKPPKPLIPPVARSVAPTPAGGASLDLKWHADNSHINNPYWQPWVPNGQGASVETGVKFGF